MTPKLKKELIDVVGSLHKNKISHNDLTLANLIIVDGRLKLIDFGDAKKDGKFAKDLESLKKF